MISWQSEIKLPEKSPDIDYGYIRKKDQEPVKCDKDSLLEVIETEKDVKFVATPDHDTFIIPGSDYFTLQPLLKKRKSDVMVNIWMAIVFILIIGGIMLLFSIGSENLFLSDKTGRLNLLIFGVIPLLNGIYDIIVINRVNENNFMHESIVVKFSYWLNQKKIVSIYIVTGIVILITLTQFITGFTDSINIAGLVKSATIEGEYWRILTGPLLHGSVIHILFNALAILIIGHMVIRITDFYMFSIVFLVSIIIGSLFSIYFMPEQTSVGASGGIMGLIGFVLIIAIKQRKIVPRNILKSMINTIILIAILGLAATDIIDNAAHGGGLFGGILMGLLMIRSKKQEIPYKSGMILTILGLISIMILLYSVVFTLIILY